MLNLSLSGCGFLGIYHIGVISAFREHAPEVLEGKISGCSAGSLVAACAVCQCCLGQMVSDVLEMALKARSHALGPLHPSFSIVDIIRNGLRRILPVDAHKICSGRVHISLTRWRDGKNFLVNQFDTREELIQALICSTFVPCYSGFIPPKFKGTYYWDGGLSNNNPILDQDTIIVSPFGGEADICPREESSSFYSYDFQGTILQFSHENIYRISKALFPPNPEILKAMCFRGYRDAISFLKARNLLQCSCNRFRLKTSISSVIGEDLNNYNNSALFIDDALMEEEQSDSMYDSEEDNISQYARSNEPLHYKEMPTMVIDILDAACDDNKGIFNYVYHSELTRAISIMFLPWTLPVEFMFKFTKRLIHLVPRFKASNHSKNVVNSLLLYLNYIMHRLTYDRYQYHSRTCKHCLPRSRSRSGSQSIASSFHNVPCNHGMSNSRTSLNKLAIESTANANTANNDTEKSSLILPELRQNGQLIASAHRHSGASISSSTNNNQFYFPKICPRHRVPSVCSSEASFSQRNNNSSNSNTPSQKNFLAVVSRRTSKSRGGQRARMNYSGSDVASSVDLNEFKLSNAFFTKNRSKSRQQQLKKSEACFSSSLPARTSDTYRKASSPKSPPKTIVEKTICEADLDTINKYHASSSAIQITKQQGKKLVHFDLDVSGTSSDDDEKVSVSNNDVYTGERLFKQAASCSLNEMMRIKDEDEENVEMSVPFTNLSTNATDDEKGALLVDPAVTLEQTEQDDMNRNESANFLFSYEEGDIKMPEQKEEKEKCFGDEEMDDDDDEDNEGEKETSGKKETSMEWANSSVATTGGGDDNYWDNLEFNAMGKLNI